MVSILLRRFVLPAALAAGMCAAVSARANSYQVVSAPGIDWASASAAAQSLGAGWQLAVINDAAENTIVTGLTPGGEFWLGGYQTPGTTVPSANWNWVNGDPFSYSNWAGGEPNDAGGPGSEQYLAMGLLGAGTWNDEGNLGLIQGFVAEHVPDSGSLSLVSAAAIGALFIAKRRQA